MNPDIAPTDIPLFVCLNCAVQDAEFFVYYKLIHSGSGFCFERTVFRCHREQKKAWKRFFSYILILVCLGRLEGHQCMDLCRQINK